MDKKDLLQKFMDYLERTDNHDNISEEEKRRAAYALNMCTVSVSQIVDYDDINILEQEYETILNNLNLEHMPKDDALLHILRQLLDTITYFRIQEGDKKMVEREYQQKVKNAVWAAVPNFGLLIAGGNLLTMGISLASQVGIGYMNYRRNKNDYRMDKDRQMWQLQRTAIEQFNGLRRELFDTAWRLADKYDFPDEYRLTERQIKQYDEILTDKDEIRKYERLDSIKSKFTAYPPFWYFFGNAANYIGGDKNLSQTVRKEYHEKALMHFEKYEELSKNNILREDSLAASCYLEHADILIHENKMENSQHVEELLEHAVDISGNENDIIELCAIEYLEIGSQHKAADLLRILVNEGYNSTINAQMLSSIYVRESDRVRYEILSTRVDPEYLYPMPKTGEKTEDVEKEFGRKLKDSLKNKYSIVLSEVIEKYTVMWNKITSVFESDTVYPDKFFLDSKVSRDSRNAVATRIFKSNGSKKEYYLGRLKNSSYELKILEILNKMFDALFNLDVFSDQDLQMEVVENVDNKIQKYQEEFNKLQIAMDDGTFTIKAYQTTQELSLRRIAGDAINVLLQKSYSDVEKSDVNNLSRMEARLVKFCDEQDIKVPELAIRTRDESFNEMGGNSLLFGPELFGHQAVVAQKNVRHISDMASFIKEKMNGVRIVDPAKIYYKDEAAFNGYFSGEAFDRYQDVRSHAVLIIKDAFMSKVFKLKTDMIFTTDGIVTVVNDKVKRLTKYAEVKMKRDTLILYDFNLTERAEYVSTSVDVQALYEVIKNLSGNFVKSIDDKVETINGTLTARELTSWFKNHPDSMRDGVVKVISYPTAKIINGLSMGYNLTEDMDFNNYILQFYYDTRDGSVLGMRIVNFDSVDSNLQTMLIEKKGYITFDR